MSKKIPHQKLREKKISKLIHLGKIQRENIWVKKITSPKSKGEQFQQTNSLQKNPKRKSKDKIYESKNTSPKSKGEKIQQTNSLQGGKKLNGS